MGLYDWAIKSARPAIGRSKARRNFSLEFRYDLKLDERCRPRFDACFSSKDIKVAPDSNAAAERDLKRLEAGVARLYPSTSLAVLNPCVMDLQLSLGGYDIIGAITFVKYISEDAKFRIIVGIINEGRLWDDVFQKQVLAEHQDDTSVGGDY